LSKGAIVGIGVGVPLGVLALAALAFFLWWRKRKGASTVVPELENLEEKSNPPLKSDHVVPEIDGRDRAVAEMDGRAHAAEIDGREIDRDIPELSSN
jgi:hypothetical protein